MTARLVSVYRYFGKLILVPFRYFSIDTYRNIDIFDNTNIYRYIDILCVGLCVVSEEEKEKSGCCYNLF